MNKERTVKNFMELLGSLPVQGSELRPTDVKRIGGGVMPF